MKSSVAICTYNGEKYITEQLHSIIHQTRKVDEIVLCDDKSSDNTVSIAEGILSKSGISYQIIRNEKSLNVVRNFQKCYSLCSGDIIFSSDQDDVWKENKVERIMSYFEKNEKLNLIATNADLIDENGENMNFNLRESFVFNIGSKEESNMFPNLLKQCCITGATMAVRKRFSDSYYFVSDYWLHDGWLSIVAAAMDSLLYLDEKLISYRLHGNNVCGVGDVTILKEGTYTQLLKEKKRTLYKRILKQPFYYADLCFEKYKMYDEVFSFVEKKEGFSKCHIQQLLDCKYFWKQRQKIKEMSFFKFKEMNAKFKNHQYIAYSEGKALYYGDIYFWVIYHIFKKKAMQH